MLLARPGEARLQMGCSMHAAAQALVRASVIAADPLISPGELRRALFRAFYGREFSSVARERIEAWLGRELRGPAETTRRVPVDWNDLETALTSNADEWTSYLDVRNGAVRTIAA